MNVRKPGALFVCATPIGNMEDITLRVLRVLREADLICAEDTRRTIKLLNHYEIKTPMTSLHEHNERNKSARILEQIKAGANIAVVSDAGMPAISDPGATLIKLCAKQGIAVTVCPGASAGITAFVLAGYTGEYAFYGFLPTDKKARLAAVERLMKETRPVIFYEAPHRIIKTITRIAAIEDRCITICRELTKTFEEAVTLSAREHLTRFCENPPRGEFVIIIPPSYDRQSETAEYPKDIYTHVQNIVARGKTESEAMKAAAKERGIGKREVYTAVVEQKTALARNGRDSAESAQNGNCH